MHRDSGKSNPMSGGVGGGKGGGGVLHQKPKVKLVDHELLCLENLFVPNFLNRSPFFNKLVAPVYSLRYYLLRTMFTPLFPGKPLPLIGDASMVYLVTVFGIVALVIYLLCTVQSGMDSSGKIAQVVGLFTVLLGMRNNINTLLFGISFERALHFHKLCGFLFITTIAFHGYYCLSEDTLSNFASPGPNLTGIILAFLTGGIALAYIFKKMSFEVFYYSHITMYVASIPIAFMHNSPIYAISCFFWALDLFVRYCLKRNAEVAVLDLLPGDVIRITIPKHFEYAACQYCFIMIPELSYLEYHPFSISSSPYDRNVRFHIRALGNWTNKLKRQLEANINNNNNNNNNERESKMSFETAGTNLAGVQGSESLSRIVLPIHVEGPFGIPSVDLFGPKYEVLVFVSAGIGVTPCQSAFNHIIHQYSFNNRKLRKVFFIWSVRDKAMMGFLKKTVRNANDTNNALDTANELPISFQPNLLNFSNKVAVLAEDAIRVHKERSGIEARTDRTSNPMKKSIHSYNDTIDDDMNGLARGLKSGSFLDADVSNTDNGDFKTISFSRGVDHLAEDVFHIDFYLTQARCKDQQEAANIFPDIQGSYLHFGRPDFDKIFKNVAEVCSYNKSSSLSSSTGTIEEVAVMVCGPEGLVEDISALCKKKDYFFAKDVDGQQSKVDFHLHSEVFDF